MNYMQTAPRVQEMLFLKCCIHVHLKNKEAVLTAFQREDSWVRVLVATIAFGMGVDCKGVHHTVHFGPSKNIEAYILETGQAE